MTAIAPHPRAGGFTLLEVMIAISLMAVISIMAWRGIDSVLQAQAYTSGRAEQQAVLQTAMAQWQLDLSQQAMLPMLPSLDWNGKVLRITRTVSAATPNAAPTLHVVAWSDRIIDGQRYWMRWESGPLYSRPQWLQAWQAALLWSQGQQPAVPGSQARLVAISHWQIFYNRDGGWTNPLSYAGGGSSMPAMPSDGGHPLQPERFAQTNEPGAIRLQLDLAAPSGYSGTVTLDWANPVTHSPR